MVTGVWGPGNLGAVAGVLVEGGGEALTPFAGVANPGGSALSKIHGVTLVAPRVTIFLSSWTMDSANAAVVPSASFAPSRPPLER
jgi:hypothetical protein